MEPTLNENEKRDAHVRHSIDIMRPLFGRPINLESTITYALQNAWMAGYVEGMNYTTDRIMKKLEIKHEE
jgi:hypothetical protein